jgi:23S rRNA (uracil1939-C5)-methyltransferase
MICRRDHAIGWATMPAKPRADQIIDAQIVRLGAQGDGVAEHEGERLFVPYTTVGDRVRVRRIGADGAEPLEFLTLSPKRAAPPCPHFGPSRCGGCLLQHLPDDVYAGWKIEMLRETLARSGLSGFTMQPLARTPPRARRRAEFAATVGRGEVRLGFHALASHEIIAIGPCPVLLPELEALLAPLRSFLLAAFRPPVTLDILATHIDGATELVFTGSHPDSYLRERLAAFAEAQQLARIAWRKDKRRSPEVIAQRTPLQARFGSVTVDLPPAAFLQASAEGEQAIIAAVTRAVGNARHVADLYAGCGAIALALAGGKRQVVAVEREGEMIAALETAARRAVLGGQIRTETRDLVRRPLIGDELRDLDAVIFDPPREGAAAQAQALAQSKVKLVVAVSCNPATFGRDARTLVDGGYRLTEVTPIDQFLWSPHLEVVGGFRR